MVNTTVMFDGQQIQLVLPDKPSLAAIHSALMDYLPASFDFRTHVIQLFDPAIGEFFDLNDDGLTAWISLPLKERNHMRLQIILAGIDDDDRIEDIKQHQSNRHIVAAKDDMTLFFQKIEHDIDTLFGAIANLQSTADGIREEFKSALAKYHKYQQEKSSPPQTSAPVVPQPISSAPKHYQQQHMTPSAPLQTLAPVNASRLQQTTQNPNNNSASLPRSHGEQRIPAKVENGNVERQIRFPAEDIRFKNKTQPPPPVVPVPVIQQRQPAPLVADVYQDEDEEEENGLPPPIDIETQLCEVGEDFQAIVSIAVNPSYFFIQNTLFTNDLEKLAQSMNDFYSTGDPPSKPFRPVEMSCCAARYSVDDRWYRARIKRYSSETSVELVYVDYGNTEDRSIHELRPLDPAFARLPTQAICAAIELLPINGDNNSSWTKKGSYKFHEDTLAKPLDARVTAQPTLQWPMHFVQLTIDEHTDLAETLISLRHGQRASLADIMRIVSPRLDLDDYAAYNLPKEILQQASNATSRQSFNISTMAKTVPSKTSGVSPGKSSRSILSSQLLPITLNLKDDVGACTVTSISSPSHFFIQLTEKNNFEQLYNSVNEKYLEKISCDQMSRLKHCTMHALGVARNNRDQRFYRVEIVNIDRERKTLGVLCFDIGEYITVQDTAIYELLPEFRKYPSQTIKCRLATIRCMGDDWSREATSTLSRFIGGKGFKTFRFHSSNTSSKAIKLDDPPLPITLYDMNTSVGSLTSINEQLVEKKLALPEANFVECMRACNDVMNDLNGYKNQRIRQYIESQRSYTQEQPKATVFIERNPVDVRYEQPQPAIATPLVPTAEPLPLLEDEENLPYCPPVVDPELGHWYAVEVTHVKTPGEFYIRYPFGVDTSLGQGAEPAPYPEEMEPNQMLNDLHRSMADLYSTEQRRGISTAASYTRGQMVAVRYQSHWYRGRVLEFKPTTNFAWVHFVDQGETRELGTNTMRPIHQKYLDLPLQAYVCRLDGFDVNYVWSAQDKDLFKKKIRDKTFFARKSQEPNVIQLVERVDGELVSFDSLWKLLHNASNKSQALPESPAKAHRAPPIPAQHQAPASARGIPPSIQANSATYPRYAHQPNVAPGGAFAPMPVNEPPVRTLQPLISGLVGYGSGSEYSQTSAKIPPVTTGKKASGVTIPPPPPPSSNRQPMTFISAGFKKPEDYAHLSPNEQMAQLQRQEGHRIQPTTYSVSKHFRPPPSQPYGHSDVNDVFQ